MNPNISTNTSFTFSLVINTATYKASQTKLYLPILDKLKFSDDTIQTTAMLEYYLTNIIQNVVYQMSLSVPTGIPTVIYRVNLPTVIDGVMEHKY